MYKESELTAVEIFEGLDIFPQTIDYWRPAASPSSPPFPIIGLNLHPKLIIGWQGSYGLMCSLKEAIENLPSSLMLTLCIILREGKYYQTKMFAHDVITLAARLATIRMTRWWFSRPHSSLPTSQSESKSISKSCFKI